MLQEFEPDETFYILAGFEYDSTPENIILLCKHITKSEDIRIYWKLKVSTAGIVHFSNEPNLYDIMEIKLHEYINKEIESQLMPKWTNLLEAEKKKHSIKWQNLPILASLPLELVELVASYISVNAIELTSSDCYVRRLRYESDRGMQVKRAFNPEEESPSLNHSKKSY